MHAAPLEGPASAIESSTYYTCMYYITVCSVQSKACEVTPTQAIDFGISTGDECD